MDDWTIMKRLRILWICIGLCGVPIFGATGDWLYAFTQGGLASAQEDWRTEFDDVCSKTQDAMVIPHDELKNLVDRCDRLKPRIEKIEESHKKVFLKRLHMCRELYFFVLESREK